MFSQWRCIIETKHCDFFAVKSLHNWGFCSPLNIQIQDLNSKVRFKTTEFSFTKICTKKEQVIQCYLASSMTFKAFRRKLTVRAETKAFHWSILTTWYKQGTSELQLFVPNDVNSPPSISMLVHLGTGKSILWLGIISAQCNTTAIAADKTGIKRSPSRSRPALGFSMTHNPFGSFCMNGDDTARLDVGNFCMWGLKRGFLC